MTCSASLHGYHQNELALLKERQATPWSLPFILVSLSPQTCLFKLEEIPTIGAARQQRTCQRSAAELSGESNRNMFRMHLSSNVKKKKRSAFLL